VMPRYSDCPPMACKYQRFALVKLPGVDGWATRQSSNSVSDSSSYNNSTAMPRYSDCPPMACKYRSFALVKLPGVDGWATRQSNSTSITNSTAQSHQQNTAYT
jgi:hypothetical protein